MSHGFSPHKEPCEGDAYPLSLGCSSNWNMPLLLYDRRILPSWIESSPLLACCNPFFFVDSMDDVELFTSYPWHHGPLPPLVPLRRSLVDSPGFMSWPPGVYWVLSTHQGGIIQSVIMTTWNELVLSSRHLGSPSLTPSALETNPITGTPIGNASVSTPTIRGAAGGGSGQSTGTSVTRGMLRWTVHALIPSLSLGESSDL